MTYPASDKQKYRISKRIILFILLLNSVAAVSAQEISSSRSARPVNSISLNFLGRGSNVAISYERMFQIQSFLFIAADVGTGYGRELQPIADTTSLNNFPKYMTIPHQISINIGKGRNFLEIGMGGTATIGNVYPHYLFYPVIGYRFQPLTSGNMKVRLFGNFPIGSQEDYRNIFFTPFGLSLGFCF